MPRTKINPFQGNTTPSPPARRRLVVSRTPSPNTSGTPSPGRRRSPSVVPQRPGRQRPRTPQTPEFDIRTVQPGDPEVRQPQYEIRMRNRRRLQGLDEQQVPRRPPVYSPPRRNQRQNRPSGHVPHAARRMQRLDWRERVGMVMRHHDNESLAQMGLRDHRL